MCYVISSKILFPVFFNWANGILSRGCSTWDVWGGESWDLWPSMISKFFLFASPSCFRNLMKCTPYWWKRLFIMYPFIVAESRISPGAFICHISWIRWPLWITSGGHTFPPVLTKDRMVEVSPCSEDTCWNILICLTPKTFTSFSTFCTPLSSSDHIWSGDMIPAVSWIFFKSWN